MRKQFLIWLHVLVSFSLVSGQEQTVGLFLNDSKSFNGYTLFSGLSYTSTYLIDNSGLLVNSWETDYVPGNTAYLLENGDLLRSADPAGNTTFMAGGDAGRVEKFDWEGNLIWEFEYSDSLVRAHHDIEPLPNGNVLILAWEFKSRTEATSAGRDSTFDGVMWPEHIIEVEPQGPTGAVIVWEWHIWNHLIQDFDSTQENFGVVMDHPELIDINFANNGTPDWLHANAVDYNPELEQIMIGIPRLHELWVIDHSTTTEEAAGHTGGNSGKGGDILYRWGNPEAYDAGTPADRKFFNQHHPHWIEAGLPGAGNILVFNNGPGRPEGDFSTIDEIVPPVDSNGNYSLTPGMAFGPEEPVWRYSAPNPTEFFARFISGAQRLENGNTLICNGAHGTFFEIDSMQDSVWLYINPVTNEGPLTQGDPVPVVNGRNTNLVYRATRYGPDYPGLANKDLTPGDPVEIDPTVGISDPVSEIPTKFLLSQNYPNPFNPSTQIVFSLPFDVDIRLTVFDVLGRQIEVVAHGRFTAGTHTVSFNATNKASGLYLYTLETPTQHLTGKMILMK